MEQAMCIKRTLLFFIPFAKDVYMPLAKQILPAGALNTGAVNLPKTVKRGKYYGGYFYTQGTCRHS